LGVNIDDIMYLGQNAMLVTMLASAPMLAAGLVVGLVVSIFQSVTQIQEMTLSFVPKILAVMVAFIVCLPWILALVMRFVQPIFGDFISFIR
jgi:flagellar biosynthetic protein FliQ